MKTRNILMVTGVVALFLVLYWPTLRWMVNTWLTSDFYTHGFIVPIVSGAIVWTKREALAARNPSWTGILLLALAVSLYAAGLILDIKVLGALSLWLAAGSLVLWIWGLAAARILLFPLVFLVFMIPLPFIQELTNRLQEISLFCSSNLLVLLGVPVATSGSQIYLGSYVFSIGLPCSGINTLIALLAAAAIYAYVLKGPFGKRLALFILAFPVAIIANILRITSIISVANLSSIETATGWYHDLSSPVFFVLAFLILVLTGALMRLSLNYAILKGK